MLMQPKMVLSQYADIYDKIIPKDNMLRKIKEMVDFSFIYDELASKYCTNNGRGAIDPVQMFKYLLLKTIFNVSDVDVVERSKYDMSFKYFLDMAPEEEVIDSSSLTKFRKLRLKDTTLLDLLISKTVEIALEKKIIKSKSIIVDSTHTKAKYNQKTPREVLIEQSKSLRKAIYNIDESLKTSFPAKVNNGILEDEIEYCKKLINVIEDNKVISEYPVVKENLNLLKETIEDDLEQLALSKDTDAKVGHKTADTSFFGYKTHIAMTEERIITAAVVTSDEKHDGKQLKTLIEKSEACGLEVKNIIGDAAYSEKENIEYVKENNKHLIAKLSKTVSHGNSRLSQTKFEYNKDADMYVCEEGHMSIKKTSTRPKKHMEFQETEYFKEKAKERYKIEAKNSEMKHRHGYDVASAAGLIGMQMQGALTIFTVNLKRIINLSK